MVVDDNDISVHFNVASLLLVQMERVLKTKIVAEEFLHKLMPSFDTGLHTLSYATIIHYNLYDTHDNAQNPEKVKQWINEESIASNFTNKSSQFTVFLLPQNQLNGKFCIFTLCIPITL